MLKMLLASALAVASLGLITCAPAQARGRHAPHVHAPHYAPPHHHAPRPHFVQPHFQQPHFIPPQHAQPQWHPHHRQQNQW